MSIKMMKAIGLKKYLPITEKESLIESNIEIPKVTGRNILVKIESVGVNPVDTKIRGQKNKPDESNLRVLGWDAYGEVKELGSEARLFKKGDKVYYSGGITFTGCNSQFHSIDERLVSLAPKTLPASSIASFPLVSLTAYESLFDRLLIDENGKDAGKSILIIGGAGGVGSIAISLAKLAGLKVIATAKRSESIEWCKKMGADLVIDHEKDLRPQLEESGFKFVDFILCLNNTDKYFDIMADLIAPEGKINSIVEMKAPCELTRLMSKSATFSFEFMTTRPMYSVNMERQGKILSKIASLIDSGKIQDITNLKLTGINVKNLQKAHGIIESGTSIGKITITGW